MPAVGQFTINLYIITNLLATLRPLCFVAFNQVFSILQVLQHTHNPSDRHFCRFAFFFSTHVVQCARESSRLNVLVAIRTSINALRYVFHLERQQKKKKKNRFKPMCCTIWLFGWNLWRCSSHSSTLSINSFWYVEKWWGNADHDWAKKLDAINLTAQQILTIWRRRRRREETADVLYWIVQRNVLPLLQQQQSNRMHSEKFDVPLIQLCNKSSLCKKNTHL